MLAINCPNTPPLWLTAGDTMIGIEVSEHENYLLTREWYLSNDYVSS